MINRRRFLQDSLAATAGLSAVPFAAATGQALEQGVPVSFDLHSHPGGFYGKGQPGYAGDAAIVKTVTAMRDAHMPVPNYNREPAFSWDACFEVPDPDALAAEFALRGVPFSAPLADGDDSLRGFVIKDFDGYGLSFGCVRS